MSKNNLKPTTLSQCRIGDRIQYGKEGRWKKMQGTLSRIDKHEYEKYYYFKNAVDLTHGRKNLPEEQSGWIEEKGMWFLIESIPVNSNETFKSKSGKVITCEVKHVI